MKARLNQFAERINGLSLRERGLLALAVLAVILLLWDALLMNPVRERQQRVQTELEQVRERVSGLTGSIQTLAVERAQRPDEALVQRRLALLSEIEFLEQRLLQAHGEVGDPRQSLSLLAGLLAERAGLNLVKLENLPAQVLTGIEDQPVPGLFVHRVRLVLDANHEGIRDYLALLAELPTGVFLESMHLTVPDWPRNRVELILFSLSLDENWLGV
ncbi:MAG: type II secretion system protein M [Wenzhouxiangella sp.]|nr:type II secretion system protein M [Wenzhouxiangella sp.]MCH8476612.1 hypothetical protein [Wenzhouxiangella sp.]TVR95783.1 MAG: hypothetical protein EA418_06930 [Wenzhouxiangellaceae bacterium]